jgi:hypothetical protein
MAAGSEIHIISVVSVQANYPRIGPIAPFLSWQNFTAIVEPHAQAGPVNGESWLACTLAPRPPYLRLEAPNAAVQQIGDVS